MVSSKDIKVEKYSVSCCLRRSRTVTSDTALHGYHIYVCLDSSDIGLTETAVALLREESSIITIATSLILGIHV